MNGGPVLVPSEFNPWHCAQFVAYRAAPVCSSGGANTDPCDTDVGSVVGPGLLHAEAARNAKQTPTDDMKRT
jgi:hypothetical protein